MQSMSTIDLKMLKMKQRDLIKKLTMREKRGLGNQRKL